MPEPPYREVPLLRKGIEYTVLVDEEDWTRLGHHRWYRTSRGYGVIFIGGVGRCGPGVKGPGRYVYLHRAVMGCEPRDGNVVDHINGDRLDNRRSNLRIITPRQNRQNVAGYGKYSKHRGVSFDKARGCWIAYLKIPGGQLRMLGRFGTEGAAAAAATAARAEHMPYAIAR